jgi:hypothetical protein
LLVLDAIVNANPEDLP